MSKAAYPLILGALGGIQGGAQGLQNQVREEAEMERKTGFQRLLQEFRRDDMEFQANLTRQNRDEQWKHEGEVLADTREYNEGQKTVERAQQLADEERKRTTGKEDAIYLAEEKAKIESRYREPKDTTGELGKAYRDALNMYGGDKEKALAFVESMKVKATSKGGLTDNQIMETISTRREEFAADPDAQPRKEGGFLGFGEKDIEGKKFNDWYAESYPEEYAIIYGGTRGKGLVGSAMSKTAEDSKRAELENIKPSSGKPQLRPGQIVKQNGVEFVVNESGVPVPKSKAANEREAPPKGENKTNEGGKIDPIESRMAELEYQRKANRGLVSTAGAGEVVSGAKTLVKEGVNAAISQAKTAWDVYMALVGEPVQNAIEGIVSFQEKQAALSVLDQRYRNGVIAPDAYRKAKSLLEPELVPVDAREKGIIGSAMQGDEYQLPPRDKSQLKVGQKYRSASGRTAVWDGKGFLALDR